MFADKILVPKRNAKRHNKTDRAHLQYNLLILEKKSQRVHGTLPAQEIKVGHLFYTNTLNLTSRVCVILNLY